MISLSVFLLVELVAAAALALWVAARFPRLGPTSLRSGLVLAVTGMGLVELGAFGVPLVARLPHGTYVALFGCVLPAFFAAFLGVAWLMRLLTGSLGGSGGGGGGGHRVPAPARR